MKKTFKAFKSQLIMRKLLLILFLCIGSTYICNAQAKGNDDINTVKIAYLTNQLNLTPEEAQKFWPIYNRYFSEVKKSTARQ